jgi:hypothetical protein
VADALLARHCTIWAVARDEADARALKPRCEEVVVGDAAEMDLAATFASVAFDVVLALGVIDETPRPDAVLASIAACLPARGRAIVSATNATHIDARLDALRPPLGGMVGQSPAARFDRAGLEAMLHQAGLTPVELLRVVRAPRTATLQAEPGGFNTVTAAPVPPEVVAWLGADPEATTIELVAVATAGDEVPSATSLAEHLQTRINHLEIALADARDRAAELEHAFAARGAEMEGLQAAARLAEEMHAQHRSRTAESEEALLQRMTEREDMLRQRMAELDSLDHALKLLQADLTLKDAYIVELRSACQHAEAGANAARAEAVQLRTTIAAVETSRDAERAEVARLRHFEDELAAVKARSGYRLLERATASLESVPAVIAGAKWVARRLAPRR